MKIKPIMICFEQGDFVKMPLPSIYLVHCDCFASRLDYLFTFNKVVRRVLMVWSWCSKIIITANRSQWKNQVCYSHHMELQNPLLKIVNQPQKLTIIQKFFQNKILSPHYKNLSCLISISQLCIVAAKIILIFFNLLTRY